MNTKFPTGIGNWYKDTAAPVPPARRIIAQVTTTSTFADAAVVPCSCCRPRINLAFAVLHSHF